MRYALLGLAIMGCASKAPEESAPDAAVVASQSPVRLTRLRVVDQTPPTTRPVQLKSVALHQLVAKALGELGHRVDKAPTTGWRMSVEISLGYGRVTDEGLAPTATAGPIRLVWDGVLKARAPGESAALPFFMTGKIDGQWDPKDGAFDAALTGLAQSAATAIAQGVDLRVKGLTATGEGLQKRLSDPLPENRQLAAELLAYRRLPGAPKVVAEAAVSETDRAVKLRLVGLLAEIGDETAAPALMQLANPKDRELLSGVLLALSVVGGERVGDFLQIMAQHDDPRVQAMVADAQKRLERKAKAP